MGTKDPFWLHLVASPKTQTLQTSRCRLHLSSWSAFGGNAGSNPAGVTESPENPVFSGDFLLPARPLLNAYRTV